jgi:hypothetical protein
MRRILVGGFGVLLIFIAVNAHGLFHEARFLAPGPGTTANRVAQGFPMLPLEGLCSKLPLELMAHISAMSRVHIWRSYLLLLAFCAACLLVGFALTLLVQVRFLWLSLARTYAS